MIYPTAAKLVAAVLLGATGFLLSGIVMPLMPEGTDFGWFALLNLVLGVLTGWITVGQRAGRGMSAALGNGLTGGAALLFWALFAQSFNEMLRLAMRKRYEGPLEALLGLLGQGFEWATLALAHPPFTIGLVVGAIATGFASEIAAKLWR